MVGASSERPAHPEVDDVEPERMVDAQVGVQAVRRCPGAEPDSGRGFAGAPGRAERQHVSVDQDLVPIRDQTFAADLDPLHRRVDEARGPSRRRLLAQDVPRLERVADFQEHDTRLDLSGHRAPQLEERAVGLGGMRQAATREELQHVREISPDPRRKEELVVQRKTPAHQRGPVRFLRQGGRSTREPAGPGRPSCADGEASRRRAARSAPGARAPCARSNSLSMQISARCVFPVTSTSRLTEEAVAQPGRRALAGRLRERAGERDLQLVERRRAGPRRCAAPAKWDPTNSPLNK